MDIVSNSLKQVDTSISGILANPVYYGILAIFLAMYGPRLSPKLPKPIRQLFNNNYFRFAVILLVIYMSNKDLSMALIITIGFILVMSLANSQEVEEQFTQNGREGFSEFDSIREFYDDEEEFTNPNSPENIEQFEDAGDSEESEELQGPGDEDEDFQGPSEGSEDFGIPAENERFGIPHENGEDFEEKFVNFEELQADADKFEREDDEDFTDYPDEEFTDYEKHLKNVVETYKYKSN